MYVQYIKKETSLLNIGLKRYTVKIGYSQEII